VEEWRNNVYEALDHPADDEAIDHFSAVRAQVVAYLKKLKEHNPTALKTFSAKVHSPPSKAPLRFVRDNWIVSW
jgi:hypothetical protein